MGNRSKDILEALQEIRNTVSKMSATPEKEVRKRKLALLKALKNISSSNETELGLDDEPCLSTTSPNSGR